MVLNSLNLSFKIIVSNQYVGNQDFFSDIQRRDLNDRIHELGEEYRELVKQRIENGRNGF